MGDESLLKRKDQKQVPLILFLSVLLSILIACHVPSAQAETDPNSTLNAVEQKLFFKTYADDDKQNRLERIEKRIFGEVMQGDFQERLNRVAGAATPQTNPDGTMTGSVTQQDSSSLNSGGTTSSGNNKLSAEDEKQAALERARIAAEALKEEQISSILSNGVNLWRAKRGREALQQFEQVIRLDPNNAEAFYYAGICYESAASLKEALSDYQRAASLKPDNSEYTDAVSAVQKKIAVKQNVSPQQAEISRLATNAAAAYKRGEYLSAVDLYKQLDALAPNQALVKYNLGTLYMQIKDPYTALNYYQQAASLKPSEARYVQAYQQLQAQENQHNASTPQGQPQQTWAQPSYNQPAAGQQTGNTQAPQSNFRRPALNLGEQAASMPPQGNFSTPQQQQQPTFQQQQPPQQQQFSSGVNQNKSFTPPLGFTPGGYQPELPQAFIQTQPTTKTKNQSTSTISQLRNQGTASTSAQTPNPNNVSTNHAKPLVQPPANASAQYGIIVSASKDGVKIGSVGIASRASKAGLQRGDIIRAVDGNVLKSADELNQILTRKNGASVQLYVQRKQQMGMVNL